MNAQTLLIQKLEATDLAFLDLTFCPILRTVVNTVDIISWGWDLFKSLWSVVAGEGLVAPFTIDVEREVLDHI